MTQVVNVHSANGNVSRHGSGVKKCIDSQKRTLKVNVYVHG